MDPPVRGVCDNRLSRWAVNRSRIKIVARGMTGVCVSLKMKVKMGFLSVLVSLKCILANRSLSHTTTRPNSQDQ